MRKKNEENENNLKNWDIFLLLFIGISFSFSYFLIKLWFLLNFLGRTLDKPNKNWQ